jgi:hypothetical protein
VACSNANVVAAVDISEPRIRVAGFVPAGAYPTSVRAVPDGRLLVLNGHGASLSVIGPLADESLAAHTRRALELSPYRAAMAGERPAARSLFEHAVYILADTGPSPPRAPNYAKLAREFVRFQNYRARGAGLAAAHLWAVAGIAPAFTERLAPSRAASRLRLPGLSAGEPANLPPAGYLWSNARAAGLTVRNYGEFVENGRATDPSLASVTDLDFQGTDVERTRVFLAALKQADASGTLARLTLLRLDGDDSAVGAIVEAISRTRFWPSTVIFAAALDGRPGGLLAVSPYTKRGAVDDMFYDQTSVLRTIELILGLRPMTMFDASARPLTAAFTTAADTTPYTAETARP